MSQNIAKNRYIAQNKKQEILRDETLWNLLTKGCFSRKQLKEFVGTPSSANQVIYEYQKKGLIKKEKRNFYVVINIETMQSVLTRYQINANLFSDACIMYHSAFEVF